MILGWRFRDFFRVLADKQISLLRVFGAGFRVRLNASKMVRIVFVFLAAIVIASPSQALTTPVSSHGTRGANGRDIRQRDTGQPYVTLNPPAPGASQLSGYAYNVDTTTIKAVIYVLTNEWYVQPLVDAPFTNISARRIMDKLHYTPGSSIVVLLVNPANYSPAATRDHQPSA